jgi:L-fuculose-phosphate aldolase
MEILEAYCRTVVVGTHLGKELNTFSPKHLQDLLNIKQKLGVPDRRIGLKECELCDNEEWRPGVTCTTSPPLSGSTHSANGSSELEAAIQTITDQIMEQLSSNDR